MADLDTVTGHEPLLSASEEVDLAKAIEAGLYAQHLLQHGDWQIDATAEELRQIVSAGRRAFDQFVLANTGLAAWWAHRRAGRRATKSVPIEDLVSVGILGVVRAVQKFDYTKGWKFSTYASNWIRNMQARAVAEATAASLPDDLRDACASLHATISDFTREHGREPTAAELSELQDLPEPMVRDLLTALMPALSLDKPLTSNPGRAFTLADTLTTPAPEQDGDSAERVAALLSCLSRRERDLIETLFGLTSAQPCRVEQFASARGLRTDIVDRAVATALNKMRTSNAAAA